MKPRPSCFGGFRSPQSDAENGCHDCAHNAARSAQTKMARHATAAKQGAIKPRPFQIAPTIRRAPYRLGWYIRWGRRLWLRQTIMGIRP